MGYNTDSNYRPEEDFYVPLFQKIEQRLKQGTCDVLETSLEEYGLFFMEHGGLDGEARLFWEETMKKPEYGGLDRECQKDLEKGRDFFASFAAQHQEDFSSLFFTDFFKELEKELARRFPQYKASSLEAAAFELGASLAAVMFADGIRRRAWGYSMAGTPYSFRADVIARFAAEIGSCHPETRQAVQKINKNWKVLKAGRHPLAVLSQDYEELKDLEPKQQTPKKAEMLAGFFREDIQNRDMESLVPVFLETVQQQLDASILANPGVQAMIKGIRLQFLQQKGMAGQLCACLGLECEQTGEIELDSSAVDDIYKDSLDPNAVMSFLISLALWVYGQAVWKQYQDLPAEPYGKMLEWILEFLQDLMGFQRQ